MSDRALDIAPRIRRMAAMMLMVKPGDIADFPLSDAGATSRDLIDLVLQVEAEFNINISDLEVSGLKSVPDFAKVVAAKLGVTIDA
jgi:acyl carrier protein